MSISVSMTSVVSQSAATSGSGGGSQSTIEALQKKLVSLQKELQEAVKTPTKEGQAKAKLIQMQIAVTQAQLEQLIQQKAKESTEKQTQNKSEHHQTIPRNTSEITVYKSAIIDEFA